MCKYIIVNYSLNNLWNWDIFIKWVILYGSYNMVPYNKMWLLSKAIAQTGTKNFSIWNQTFFACKPGLFKKKSNWFSRNSHFNRLVVKISLQFLSLESPIIQMGWSQISLAISNRTVGNNEFKYQENMDARFIVLE